MTAQNYLSEYEPPYDSPIEDIFAWHCHKYLSSGIKLDKQVDIDTQHGRFRIDFALSDVDERIAVECDGRDFHELFRDEFRDAILLGEGHFDTIYHFRGCDITYHPDDCIWLMSVLNPKLFSERGHLHLDRLHKLEVGENYDLANRESYSFRVYTSGQGYPFWAFRRTIHVNPKLKYHWKVLYAFACEHPGASVDELVGMRVSSRKLIIES